MFYDFYNLTGLPFEERLAPDKLLADERFARGAERLDYFAHAGLAALVTGPTGVGKSALLRLFISRLLNNLATLCLIQGAAKKQHLITTALVDEAARELRMV